MRFRLLIGFLAGFMLAGCASSLPERDFRADYQRATGQHVRIEGYAPFAVDELRAQRRLRVQLNVLAQAFGWASDPLVLLGITSGIPPLAAHRAAAQRYLADTGRPSCTAYDSAVMPNGRAFEFRYSCSGVR